MVSAAYAIAHALHDVARRGVSPEVSGANGNFVRAEAIKEALLRVDFQGVTGRVRFSNRHSTLGDRDDSPLVAYEVLNVDAAGDVIKLATWTSSYDPSNDAIVEAPPFGVIVNNDGAALVRPTADGVTAPHDLAPGVISVGLLCRHAPGSTLYQACQHAMMAVQLINDKSDGERPLAAPTPRS